jgi:hypothetical protein
MIAESGESGVSQRSRCAAVRKNATFRADFSAVLQNVAKKYRLFGKASRGLGSGQRTTMSSLGTANTAISSVLSRLGTFNLTSARST